VRGSLLEEIELSEIRPYHKQNNSRHGQTHYYPFGLTMAGISGKASSFGQPGNKYKYNGGNELQSKEFSDASGLELYNAVHRLYDPQLGRFHQLDALSDIALENSPYVFASNNPISINDPLGLADSTNKRGNVKPELPPVTVYATRHKSKSHDTNPIVGMFTQFIGAIDTFYDFYSKDYDHKNYITTKGKVKPIPVDVKRMSQQAKTAKLKSYSIKNVGFGISLLANLLTLIQVRDQYLKGGLGGIDKVDGASLALGTTGLFATGLSKFGIASKTLGTVSEFTGVGGLAIGVYQTWMTSFQIMYNTNLPNANPYSGDANTQFQAAIDDQASGGNKWH
jgi:RHS repeat-associated protein